MKKPTALGCRIYAGGFSLGVRDHFKILAHLEDEKPYGRTTVERNFPGLPIIGRGRRGWDLEPYRGVDWIYGNPPCAAWSRAGKMVQRGGASWRDDVRLEQTREHFELLRALRPAVWATESVQGAWTRGQDFALELMRSANRLGYSTTAVLVNAKWYGVAQSRPRYFLVAHRIEINWQLPKWIEPRTVGDALDDVPKKLRTEVFAEQRLEALIPNVEAGKMIRDAWERNELLAGRSLAKDHRGLIAGRPTFGIRRLHRDKPALVMAGYVTIHPTEDRFISVKELQVLCGFPVGYEFVGTTSQKPSLIARGVCPPVAAWLALNVAGAVKRNRPAGEPRRWLLDLNKPPGSLTEIGVMKKRRMFA